MPTAPVSLAFRLRPFRPLRPLRPLALQARPLSGSAVLRHKESESEDPNFSVEKLKEQSLEDQKKGHGEWMPGLASDSEEAIKADKSSGPSLPSTNGKSKAPLGPTNPTVLT